MNLTAPTNAFENDATLVNKVVILANSALGELLLTLPLVQESRRIYRAASITLVCSRAVVAGFARELAVADDVILLPKGARRSPIALQQSRLMMERTNPDILLQPFTSHGTFGN